MSDDVEKKLGYIGARLREKSTYGGLAFALGTGLALYHGNLHIDPTRLAGALESIGIGIGIMIGIFLPEKTVVRVVVAALLSSALLSTIAPGARAASLPQAPVPSLALLPSTASPCKVPTATTALDCSGGYVGVGIGGEGSNANILGNGISGSVFAGGMTPSVDTGYLYAEGNWIAGAEARVGYSFNTGAQVNGVGNGFNGFRITEDFKVGGNLAGMLGTQTPITIPASLQQAILGPYAHVGVTEWQLPGGWAVGNESGAGVLFDFPPINGRPVFGDLNYTYTNFNGANAGAVKIQNDQSILLQVNMKLN